MTLRRSILSPLPACLWLLTNETKQRSALTQNIYRLQEALTCKIPTESEYTGAGFGSSTSGCVEAWKRLGVTAEVSGGT